MDTIMNNYNDDKYIFSGTYPHENFDIIDYMLEYTDQVIFGIFNTDNET